jgi:hypothetical protein
LPAYGEVRQVGNAHPLLRVLRWKRRTPSRSSIRATALPIADDDTPSCRPAIAPPIPEIAAEYWIIVHRDLRRAAFEECMAVADIARQYAASGTRADRL